MSTDKCEADNKTGGKCNFKKVHGFYCIKHSKYIKNEKYGTNAVTITFGDQAENHVGMQKIGEKRDVGYNLNDFKDIINKCKDLGIVTELIDLKQNAINFHQVVSAEDAYVLVIRNGADSLLDQQGKNNYDLYNEHINLKWDTKAKMYGKVNNKKLRHNLCFGEKYQEADYRRAYGTR